jgi:hypothetical protein
LLAAACSKPKSQVAQTGGESKGAEALDSDSGTKPGADKTKGAAAAVRPKSYQVSGPAAKGYSALNPGADVAQAKKVGALIKLQSTSYSKPNTWLGVTKDTITLDFAMDTANCGVNIIGLVSQAGGNLGKETRFYRKAPSDQSTINAEAREGVTNIVRYWNDHVGDVANDIPQAVQVMKKYNKPGHNFYGRRLKYNIIDGGSFQCQDKQTAAALTMRDRTKPFSAVVYDVPGLYENGVSLASAMKAKIPANKRPMIFGLIDTSDKFLSQFAPYAWDEFQSITKMSRLGASWICAELKGPGPNAKLWGNGKAVNSRGSNAAGQPYSGMTRKFGLIYANSANSNQAASEFKSFLKSGCNLTFDRNTTEFQIDPNPARATDQGNQIATRFKVNNVTSVIYLVDFLGAFFHIIDFRGQNYRPEIVGVGTGWQTNTVQRLSPFQDMVDKSSMFYTSFGIQGFGYGPGDAFWVYHTYHKVSPRTKKACDPRTDAGMSHDVQYCKAPGAIVGWYYSWLPLIGGMIFAGPNLTPGTAAAGLHAYPLTRYGVDGPTSDPVAVLVGAGPGQYYFITDGSSGRWRAGFVSPPPEQQLGFPDYPDCQRHYLAWPNKLAPQWEKGGPNYNAWCGNAKYTQNWKDPGTGKPIPYQPSARSGQKCDGTPSKTCERDNYPRWQPILYR